MCSSQASSAAKPGSSPRLCNWYHCRISPGRARLTTTGSAANVRTRRATFWRRFPLQAMAPASADCLHGVRQDG